MTTAPQHVMCPVLCSGPWRLYPLSLLVIIVLSVKAHVGATWSYWERGVLCGGWLMSHWRDTRYHTLLGHRWLWCCHLLFTRRDFRDFSKEQESGMHLLPCVLPVVNVKLTPQRLFKMGCLQLFPLFDWHLEIARGLMEKGLFAHCDGGEGGGGGGRGEIDSVIERKWESRSSWTMITLRSLLMTHAPVSVWADYGDSRLAHLNPAPAPHSSDEDAGKEKQSLLFALGAAPQCMCAFAVPRCTRRVSTSHQKETFPFDDIKWRFFIFLFFQ